MSFAWSDWFREYGTSSGRPPCSIMVLWRLWRVERAPEQVSEKISGSLSLDIRRSSARKLSRIKSHGGHYPVIQQHGRGQKPSNSEDLCYLVIVNKNAAMKDSTVQGECLPFLNIKVQRQLTWPFQASRTILSFIEEERETFLVHLHATIYFLPTHLLWL